MPLNNDPESMMGTWWGHSGFRHDGDTPVSENEWNGTHEEDPPFAGNDTERRHDDTLLSKQYPYLLRAEVSAGADPRGLPEQPSRGTLSL